MSKTITRDKVKDLLAIQTPRQKQAAAIERALIALDAAAEYAEVYDDDEEYALFSGAARQLREAFNLPPVPPH